MTIQQLTSVHAQARLHLWLGVLWLALAIPTVLWWRNSIEWVLIMGVYANAVGHFAAYQGARSERKQGEL